MFLAIFLAILLAIFLAILREDEHPTRYLNQLATNA